MKQILFQRFRAAFSRPFRQSPHPVMGMARMAVVSFLLIVILISGCRSRHNPSSPAQVSDTTQTPNPGDGSNTPSNSPGAVHDPSDCNGSPCVCTPQCDSKPCGQPDGCNGTCGCPNGLVCQADGQCVAKDACTDTCASLAYACGQVCGIQCGTCGATDACIEGACVAPVDTSCTDCPLQLSVIDRTKSNGRLTQVTLAVDFVPPSNVPGPRLVDIRIASNQNVTLNAVSMGSALKNGSKQFVQYNNQNWKQRMDGTWQMVAYSIVNTLPVPAGRLLTATFVMNSASPVAFQLVKRAQTFAPADADAMLDHVVYGAGVVIAP